jgi:hypothetical protein
MNMFGNFAGFVAPVGGGLILARAAGDWNVLLYLMVGASLAAAACWLFLDPEKKPTHENRSEGAHRAHYGR